jgi:hypothetical protein
MTAARPSCIVCEGRDPQCWCCALRLTGPRELRAEALLACVHCGGAFDYEGNRLLKVAYVGLGERAWVHALCWLYWGGTKKNNEQGMEGARGRRRVLMTLDEFNRLTQRQRRRAFKRLSPEDQAGVTALHDAILEVMLANANGPNPSCAATDILVPSEDGKLRPLFRSLVHQGQEE